MVVPATAGRCFKLSVIEIVVRRMVGQIIRKPTDRTMPQTGQGAARVIDREPAIASLEILAEDNAGQQIAVFE